ncbi:MAG: carbamoyltransferase HypF, partial [Lachnospiraceae bacterium]|nr:carbamoyltransferase HypF [Lachnospiraceae bacterium]
GYVINKGDHVLIVVQGDGGPLRDFENALQNPELDGCFIRELTKREPTTEETTLIKESAFLILDSEEAGYSYLPSMLPDLGICRSCLNELYDKGNVRYRYPLISCSHCGPRFTITRRYPYDRENTTMSDFELCSDCLEEYNDIENVKRHHAQTISCHNCGPQYVLTKGDMVFEKSDAVEISINIINNGGILCLKGVGGYQLLCDPFNKEAVERLRLIKGRYAKPFAVMFHDMEVLREYCETSPEDEKMLEFPARPILLINRKNNIQKPFADNVCSDSVYIGGFLPNSGIHALLTEEIPLIVTSANFSGDPMIIDDEKASEFVNKTGIDGILSNDRQILTAIDDSVLKPVEINGERRYIFLRRSRGYTPELVYIKQQESSGIHQLNKASEVYIKKHSSPASILSLGADMKGGFCHASGPVMIPSQFMGDMTSHSANVMFINEIKRTQELYRIKPDVIVTDRHPLYNTVKLGKTLVKENPGTKLVSIQHHHAHVGSVMAEKGWTHCIGVAFDGTGLGDDNTIWGSEFLLCNGADFKRMGHLTPVKLCGGDKASEDPYITAFSYLYERKRRGINTDEAIKALKMDPDTVKLLESSLENNINCVESSSMGRLFDVVALLTNTADKNTYEGRCAMKLEQRALSGLKHEEEEQFSIHIETNTKGEYTADPVTLISELLNFINRGISMDRICLMFHRAIVEMTVKICEKIREETKEPRVALSGGCFANRILLENCVKRLQECGFTVSINLDFPCGDQGIAPGQAYLAHLKESLK